MKKNKLKHIKKSGFKSPKGYFDALEDAVFAKIASEKYPIKEGFESPEGYFDTVENNVLKKLQPEKEKNNSGFKMPYNYLENVEDNVFKSINNKVKEPKVINFRAIFLKRLIPIAAAASLLIFIIINHNQSTDVNLDQLASTEIEQWINEDLISFNIYEITDVFKDIELENQIIFEEEEIENYLNGTDIESLIEEN